MLHTVPYNDHAWQPEHSDMFENVTLKVLAARGGQGRLRTFQQGLRFRHLELCHPR